MITPTFIFTIFMLTLGPIKTVPIRHLMDQHGLSRADMVP